MSKKKQKTRLEKEVKKHNFKHLAKTKVAAKMVEVEIDSNLDVKSPLNTEIGKDLRMTIIIISIFVISIVALWLLVGRNGQIFDFTDKIKPF